MMKIRDVSLPPELCNLAWLEDDKVRYYNTNYDGPDKLHVFCVEDGRLERIGAEVRV